MLSHPLSLTGGTVSRFLFYPVIYLRNLPPGKERAALSIRLGLIMPVYMVLQALVPSPPYVAIQRRELLPHGFTLTLAGGLFSVTASIRLLPSVLSTAGRPFLSGLSSADLSQPRQVIPPDLLFIAELALHLVVLCVDLRNCLLEAWSDVLAMLVALH